MPKKTRSGRLRETGVSGRVSIYNHGTSSQNYGDGHTHSNLPVLEKLGLEGDYITLHHPSAGKDRVKSKSGYSDTSGHADTAGHAETSDTAGDSKMWDGHYFQDYLDQPVRKDDKVRFREIQCSDIHGAGTFVDGLLGSGFRVWEDANGVTNITTDRLTVRETMTVLELLVQKTRSIGGQLVVSAANGKVKDCVLDGENYRITFEQENQFVTHDLIRCSHFTGSDLRSYWVEVSGSDKDCITVPKSEFGNLQPRIGDECVLMGNTTDTRRQNLILISATEDGQPRIDVMDGVSRKDFNGCLRVRLGNLDGIKDIAFGEKQPHGNGMYGDNVYLKGDFILANGENVQTKFEITDGKIDAVAEGLREDFTGDKGYLNNPIFTEGMRYWNTTSACTFFLVGNRWIWANSNILSRKGNMAHVTKDMGRNVVKIHNLYIKQRNNAFSKKPSFVTNSNGLKEPMPVFLSFFYRCTKAGRLTVEFEGTDMTGFVPHPAMHVEEDLTDTQGKYIQYSCTGLWNGTGDFKLSFTGDIYLYMLILTTDRVDSLVYKYKTLFEQSSNLVKISSAVFDKDEQCLRETGLLIKPEGSGIYMQDASGKLALIGVGVEEDDGHGGTRTVIKLTADNIRLEGLVTANGNFKILEDGSAEAWNMKLHGYLNSRFIPIRESDAEQVTDTEHPFTFLLKSNLYIEASGCKIKLPVSEEYEGARVLIFDSPRVITKSDYGTCIITDDNSPIIGGSLGLSPEDSLCEAKELHPMFGTVELTLMNYTYRDQNGQPIRSVLRWILTNESCMKLSWFDNKSNVHVIDNIKNIKNIQ